MRADPKIIAEVEELFKRHAEDPLAALCAVSCLSLIHGPEPVLMALAQVHVVTAARLRALRGRAGIEEGRA